MAANVVMPVVAVTPMRPEDILEASVAIRDADRQEVWAAHHITAEEALFMGHERSTLAWTGRVNGDIVALFGVAPYQLATRLGSPWLLGTAALEKYWLTFGRESRMYLTAMRSQYPRLVNWVDARNTKAVRWLRWLGFRVEVPQAYGVERLPFHRFTMEV